jgi:hypothetical protein
MNQNDKEAFEKWFNKERRIFEAKEPATFCDADEFCMEKGWQAACEYMQAELAHHIFKIEAENKKLREALEFYALWSNWGGDLRAGNEIISDDCDYIEKWYEYVGGKRAREALKEADNNQLSDTK